MSDQELIDGFEAGTLAPADFHHRDHVRLTWLYLERYGRDEAERRMRSGLRTFASRAGTPDKFDATLTRAWVAAIDDARLGEAASTFERLVALRPELLTRDTIRSKA